MDRVTDADHRLAQEIISGCRGYGVTIRREHSACRAIAEHRIESVGPLLDKVICGLRQVTSDMIGRASRDVALGNADEHGLDLEAMEQYADRINGYAAELSAERA